MQERETTPPDVVRQETSAIHLDAMSRQNRLLAALKHIQDRFYTGNDTGAIFDELLLQVLDITGSGYGYLACVTNSESQHFKTLAMAGEVSTDAVEMMLQPMLKKKKVLQGADTVAAWEHYIALPVIANKKLVGAIALGDDKKEYSKDTAAFLEPLMSTLTSMVVFHKLKDEKEEALARQNELNKHLHSILSTVNDIILELNGNKQFVDVWVRDERFLFMPKEQFMHKTVLEVMGPLAEQMDALIGGVIRTGETKEVIYPHLDPTKESMFKATISEINRDDDPQKHKVALVIKDITEEVKQKNELLAAKDEAEKAALAKSKFLSIMSHEIRTPLNGIIGIANLLGINHTPEQQEYVNNLIFSSNHLLRLVNDILDLSKVESDKLELVTCNVNLNQLVDSIRNQFKGMAESKGVYLKTHLDEGIPATVIADPTRLGQILNNLVSNALKFTEKGGVEVRFGLAGKTADKVKLNVSVKDTGIGIPDDMQDSVFESFTQVLQASDRKYTGTGLGLTIVKRLIALHNSEIEMKSKMGKGTEFSFTLELDIAYENDKVDKGPVEIDVEAYKDRLAKLNFLLVEDNPVNVMVAKKQLEHFGIKADTAGNGKEALALMENKSYDIALVDLHMPEMDGYELSACIRKDYPGVHIVIFTADIMSEARERIAMLNIRDIINKPFVPQEMLSILINVLNEKGL